MSDILARLKDESRYAQGSCPKCEKGFENHEYHCWGPETVGCLASQAELHKTVKKWKQERRMAVARIVELEASGQGSFAIVSAHRLEVQKAYDRGFEAGVKFAATEEKR